MHNLDHLLQLRTLPNREVVRRQFPLKFLAQGWRNLLSAIDPTIASREFDLRHRTLAVTDPSAVAEQQHKDFGLPVGRPNGIHLLMTGFFGL
jgi:hypothetical protein